MPAVACATRVTAPLMQYLNCLECACLSGVGFASRVVWQNLVERILRLKIYNSQFWKEACFGLTGTQALHEKLEICVWRAFLRLLSVSSPSRCTWSLITPKQHSPLASRFRASAGSVFVPTLCGPQGLANPFLAALVLRFLSPWQPSLWWTVQSSWTTWAAPLGASTSPRTSFVWC